MKRCAILMSAVALVLAGCASPQQPKSNRSLAQEDEIYIPRDLDDCFARLEEILQPEDVEMMKSGTEDDMIQYHFGLGMWMRNNWGLWGDSRLARWFNAQGIQHPDDMSGIILDSFWRHLNEKPIHLKEQIEHYQDYWKEQETTQAGPGTPPQSVESPEP